MVDLNLQLQQHQKVARLRLYFFQDHQDQERSPDVVTGTLQAFNLDVYTLLDPGACNAPKRTKVNQSLVVVLELILS